MLFHGKVAIVTGAGGGLGRLYALSLGSRGAKVVVNDFSQQAADRVVDEIRTAGGHAIGNYADVSDGEAVVATALAEFGTVHVIVNNAGGHCGKPRSVIHSRRQKPLLRPTPTLLVSPPRPDPTRPRHRPPLRPGVLRDKSFARMTREQWDIVYTTHLLGAMAVCKAAWSACTPPNKWGVGVSVMSRLTGLASHLQLSSFTARRPNRWQRRCASRSTGGS